MSKRLLLTGMFALAASLAIVGGSQRIRFGATSASAATLDCDTETDAQCTISSQKIVTMAPGGSETISIDRSLLIADGGSISVWVPDKGETRTLNLVVAGDLTLAGTGAIRGDATEGSRIGATIRITAQGRVALLDHSQISATTSGACLADGHGGSIDITSSYASTAGGNASISVGLLASVTATAIRPDDQAEPSCAAGDVSLSAPQGNISIAGIVESAVPSGTTDAQRLEDGGAIAIDAGCNLDVSGLVSSRGRDNGADLVHLAGGCGVTVSGTVESTGAGNVPLADNLCHGASLPEKAPAATGCVEIWSGGDLTITGDVNADLCCGGGIIGDSWVDLYAAGNISLDGTEAYAVHADGKGGQYDSGGAVTIVSTGGKVSVAEKGVSADGTQSGGSILIEAAQDVSIKGGTGTFTVHADGSIGGYNDGKGGNVSVRAFAGTLTATNDAISAAGAGNHGAGGTISVRSKSTLTLDTANLIATGDYDADAGFGTGGTISARGDSGFFSWSPTGLGDARPTGSEVDPGSDGSIFLTYCTGLETRGSTFPSNGTAEEHFPTIESNCDIGTAEEIALPEHVVLPVAP